MQPRRGKKGDTWSGSAYGARSVAVKADLHMGCTTVWSHVEPFSCVSPGLASAPRDRNVDVDWLARKHTLVFPPPPKIPFNQHGGRGSKEGFLAAGTNDAANRWIMRDAIGSRTEYRGTDISIFTLGNCSARVLTN